MRYTRVIVAALIAAAPTASAQRIESFGPEIRPFVGAYIPTSDHSNDFKAATMVGAQGAFELSENFHFVSSVSWALGHNKFAGYSTDNTNIWAYDVGGEMNLVNEITDNWFLKPFVGLGAGGRTYDYRARGVGTKTCTTGYGALGTEFQSGLVALRFEARDYLSCFQSPVTGKRQTRNDAAFTFGLAYHVR
ncbi:MAG: outer membrane beta-barrel protein [Gemmatimonadaceae bacterium]